MLRDVLMYSGLLRPETATMLGVKHVQFKSKDGLQVEPLLSPVFSPGGGLDQELDLVRADADANGLPGRSIVTKGGLYIGPWMSVYCRQLARKL